MRFTIFGAWHNGTVIATNGEIVGVRADTHPDAPRAIQWRNPAVHDLHKANPDA